MSEFFPRATRYELQTRILSGSRVELTELLGRPPTADENTLQVFRIFQGSQEVGEVTTRRVKGAHGVVEIVLAADTAGRITGLRLQRLREPEAAVQALQGAEWRRWFVGRTAESSWTCDELLARLPAEARESAKEIARGARSTLVLLSVSKRAVGLAGAASHAH